MKKEGEGKTEEKKNKKDDHSSKNLKGLLRIVVSLIKNGQRRLLAFSQSKKTPMPFFVQFAQRKLVFPIKLLVMLSDTVKQLLILSLKMK